MKIVIFDQNGIKEFIPANSQDLISDDGFLTLLQKEIQKSHIEKKPNDNVRLFTVADIVGIFKTTRPTVYAWIDKKLLNPIKLGGRVYFDPNDINDLIDKNRASAL